MWKWKVGWGGSNDSFQGADTSGGICLHVLQQCNYCSIKKRKPAQNMAKLQKGVPFLKVTTTYTPSSPSSHLQNPLLLPNNNEYCLSRIITILSLLECYLRKKPSRLLNNWTSWNTGIWNFFLYHIWYLPQLKRK